VNKLFYYFRYYPEKMLDVDIYQEFKSFSDVLPTFVDSSRYEISIEQETHNSDLTPYLRIDNQTVFDDPDSLQIEKEINLQDFFCLNRVLKQFPQFLKFDSLSEYLVHHIRNTLR